VTRRRVIMLVVLAMALLAGAVTGAVHAVQAYRRPATVAELVAAGKPAFVGPDAVRHGSDAAADNGYLNLQAPAFPAEGSAHRLAVYPPDETDPNWSVVVPCDSATQVTGVAATPREWQPARLFYEIRNQGRAGCPR
jgi:hypothetical protein